MIHSPSRWCAVGIDLFTRLASGELRLEDIGDHATGGRWMIDNIAIRTKFYDDFSVTQPRRVFGR